MEKKAEVQVSDEFATSWKRALNAVRKTVGKKRLNKEPSDVWKVGCFLQNIHLFDWLNMICPLKRSVNGSQCILSDTGWE